MYACCCCCCRNVEVLQEQLHAAQQQTQQAHAAQKEAQQQLEELQLQQQQHRDWHALLQACAQAAEVSRCLQSNAAYAAQQAWWCRPECPAVLLTCAAGVMSCDTQCTACRAQHVLTCRLTP